MSIIIFYQIMCHRLASHYLFHSSSILAFLIIDLNLAISFEGLSMMELVLDLVLENHSLSIEHLLDLQLDQRDHTFA